MRRTSLLLAVGLAVVLPACATTTDDVAADDPVAASTSAVEGDDGDPSPELASALQDVGRLAPALESAYRGGDYPRELDAVVDSLGEVGLELSDDNALGGYRYDPNAVEFELCVEHTGGAWATYDTAPMSVRRSGESGGCPEL